MKIVHIIGGGTVFHVTNHFGLCAPAYGTTARKINSLFFDRRSNEPLETMLHLTKMAGGAELETNEDISKFVDELLAKQETKMIVFNAALCDWEGVAYVNGVSQPIGKYNTRLRTSTYNPYSSSHSHNLVLIAANKIVEKIKKQRPDIILACFKTTCGEQKEDQLNRTIDLQTRTNADFVLGNDTKTRRNIIIDSNKELKWDTHDRDLALITLVNLLLTKI